MSERTNVLFLLVDQLRAASLPLYGETQIETPHIDRLARDGTVFDHAISTCPVCTPTRSMLVTGRHPQTTGHIVNFVRTRHDEIGIGDAFGKAGYRTGWIGKWHLHTGSFPHINGFDFVPEGRDRLGFQHWRGYNFHMDYFEGSVNIGDWRNERWQGYETDALNRYAFEFLDTVGDEPFCLFVSPHQPHATPFKYAPEEYYDRLPTDLTLPANVPESIRAESLAMYRNYLAMTLAIDDMLGEILDYLDRTGKAANTLVIFSSDHGTQVGAQEVTPWAKMMPYQDSLHVPLIMRLPGLFEGGRHCDVLTTFVDLFPSLCSLCHVPIPRTVEGFDLAPAWRGDPGAFTQDAVLTMNFTATYDYLLDGQEWRGLRTQRYNFTRWLSGKVELFDLEQDPLEMDNLAGKPEHSGLHTALEARLDALLKRRNDKLVPCSSYQNWFDYQRRVVRNVYGPLGDPEDQPDWSLLQ